MKRITLYVIAAVFSFLCFVVAFAPASPVWLLIEDDVNAALPELKVYDITGTIWTGSARIQYQRFPASQLQWQLDPLSLIRGAARLNLIARGQAHDLVGNGELSGESGRISRLSGSVDSQYVNTVSERYGLTFSGELNIDRFMLQADPRWITNADGLFHWTGGRIVYRTRTTVQVFDLPALDGILNMIEDRLRLAIVHQDRPVLDIVLQPSGFAQVDLRARLFELGNLPWPEGQAPDETVLQVEEKLFPGRSPGPGSEEVK